jgi:GNAT superfamily N-acetyltransferase
MAADMPAAEDGPAQLDPVRAPADAAAMVAGVYAAVIAGDPAFAGELYAASESDLAQCQDEGTLHWIVADGARAGVIASQPGDVEMLPGHVIVEEAVLPAFRGRGLAAAAQRRLAGILAGQAADAVITGTIFAGNMASRRTAERAGRPALLNYWFALLAAG